MTADPETGPSTRERLLTAAEELLAARAEHEITVRDITLRAGANIAAVGYHFGSRDALILETLRRVIERMTDERRREIDGLPPDANLDGVLRAWLGPALATLGGTTSDSRDWQIMSRTFLTASPLLDPLVAEMRPEIDASLLTRLSALLPHLTPEELAWRYAATLALAGALGTLAGTPLSPPGDEGPDRLIAYVSGALTSPPAQGARARGSARPS